MTRYFYIFFSIVFFNNNFSDIIKLSGKPEDVLNLVKEYLPSNPIIIEAGAYNGADTLRMITLWPSSTIYAFEPVPAYFDILSKNTSKFSNIQRFQLALGEKIEQSVFYLASHATTGDLWPSGSLLKPKEHLNYANYVKFDKKIVVEKTTLDAWVKNQGIDRVDFMWLDMQGYELPALMAGCNILKSVKVVYTEVEFVEAYKKQFLYRDVKSFLEKQGFSLVAQDFDDNEIVTKKGNGRWYGNVMFVRNKNS